MSTELYDRDFYQWALKNAELMRQGKLSEIDVENIAEELESMGKSQKREFVSRLRALLMHLLKWQYQPDRKGESWKKTIIEQRDELILLIEDSPSLKHVVEESVDKAYCLALDSFENETGISKKNLPASCSYSFEQLMDKHFWP